MDDGRFRALKSVTELENVSRETVSTLEEFSAILLKWNQRINLVSKRITEEELWQRHILDCAQLVKFIPNDKKSVVDFGSGAGFPGIILAIIGGYKVTLIESDQRKCVFLKEMVAKFKLNATVINARIEEVKPFPVDIITSRALASLVDLLHYSHKFVDDSNFMLFLKGHNVVEEIKEASICWGFLYDSYVSTSHQAGSILKISKLRSVP